MARSAVRARIGPDRPDLRIHCHQTNDHMTQTTSPQKRTRTLALSFGLAIGMLAGAYAPQMAHAATKAKAKPKAAASSLATADEQQLAAAERVLYGTYACEFGKKVTINRDARNTGYVNLSQAAQSWTMKPVASTTGAIRLEDVQGRTLMLQILTKSMLMDQKTGHRLVDGCVHPTQRAAEENLQHNPVPSNL
jgi:hypothetical protein